MLLKNKILDILLVDLILKKRFQNSELVSLSQLHTQAHQYHI